jgi:hypothetical protein
MVMLAWGSFYFLAGIALLIIPEYTIVLGTANAVSFTFLTGSAALYWLMRPAFGETPQRIFLVSAGLMAVGAAFFLWRLGPATFSRQAPNLCEGVQEN